MDDLGIRASRARVVCASQCVGLELTASGGCGSRGFDLGICSWLSISPAQSGSSWWPFGGHLVARRAEVVQMAPGSASRFSHGSCAIQTIARPAGFSWGGRGRRRAASLSAVPVGRTELDRCRRPVRRPVARRLRRPRSCTRDRPRRPRRRPSWRPRPRWPWTSRPTTTAVTADPAGARLCGVGARCGMTWARRTPVSASCCRGRSTRRHP